VLPRPPRPFDDAQELFHVRPRELLIGECAEESGQVRSQFFVCENVVGDAARVHGGGLHELEPVVPDKFEADLSCLSPKLNQLFDLLADNYGVAPTTRTVSVEPAI
jgi:hypothetical protein